MFGYDYEIIYNKGKENVVVDALSRKYEEEGSLFSLSFLVSDWLRPFNMNGSKIPNCLASSNNCNKILMHLHDTLGTMRSFDTNVTCI
jgi:hypothetical protein